MSALAKAKGVSKQAVSKNLERWAAAGRPVATRKDGRSVLVNVAEYDTAKAEVGDPVHLLTEERKREPGNEPSDPTLAREQARRAGYDADLKFIEREKQLGRLVEIAELERAAIDCGEAMVRVLDQLATRAEEVAAAVAKDGVIGARAVLKAIAKDVRTRAAQEFAKLPTIAMSPATSPSKTEA